MRKIMDAKTFLKDDSIGMIRFPKTGLYLEKVSNKLVIGFDLPIDSPKIEKIIDILESEQ